METLAETASRVLPGGSFGNFPANFTAARGHGGHIWDTEGREYIDYLIGSGPMFIGHAHPAVTEAILAQVPLGTTYFANNPSGIELAAAIVDAVPCAEQVRFVSSGSEADAYAMRLARAFTGREKILKFEGGYHGMSDSGLMSLAPKREANFPQAIPDSPGIPSSVADAMLVAPFNDLEAALALLEAHADELGGVIVEPLQRLIPPKPGFLAGLREATARLGIPLIFDEVVTGFRFAYGGAQEMYGVTPDICTLGKIVGGGFPLAAVAGRADIMALFDRAKAPEDKFLTQIGTLSGNPVASVAGLATLKVLREPGTYEAVFARGEAMMGAMNTLLRKHGVPGQALGVPVLFDIVYADGTIANYRDMLKSNAAHAAHVNKCMRDNGVLKGDSKYYLATAHTDADIAHTLEVFEKALRTL
ncbi:aminotransferase class III-fold pyridoxal phosphate-dependent enzyme [Rhodovarius crocodyli]|uniref:Glutamate-1-semialdehyde 2,1-aminomutase n=1 Tax=Rhodovarius crocodyli TaxID=1979269 RepID=A0A437MGJ5_9PROT|nr:aminotransferase class III-fold pyridoxal phosphate-dependent enzyme [Rhodovarius crocodyli]RVT96773.1 aminotransferase class III-fold pyridoxal phosphate-dependent enzyme [Rhodovarius crocodyli]